MPVLPKRAARLGVVSSAVIATAAALPACGGSSTGGPGQGSDAAAVERPSNGGDAAPVDTFVADAGLSHCPTGSNLHGPALVRVRWNDGVAFCIDATEVTNADYAQFVAAGAPAPSPQPRCAWNASRMPETQSTNGPACPAFDPATRPNHPVVCVDWCDADAYCRWAGKRLCGKPGGGTVGSVTAKDASEWVIACSNDGAAAFPYGDMAEAGRCVDRQYPTASPGVRPAMEAATCEGGYAGLFDMSGNAWEWQDDCVVQGTADGSEDACSPLGGSFSSDVAMAACTAEAPFFRRQVAGDTGFRCCVDAQFF